MAEPFEIELELEHKTLIAKEIEKGTFKSAKELPAEIKNAITGLNLKIGKYAKNPTLKEKESIEIKSCEIHDDILNWIEDKDTVTPPAEPKEPKEPATPPAETDEQKAAATAEAEKKLLEILKTDGKIYSKQLKEILKADSINSIPDKLKVGNTIIESNIFGYYYKKEK